MPGKNIGLMCRAHGECMLICQEPDLIDRPVRIRHGFILLQQLFWPTMPGRLVLFSFRQWPIALLQIWPVTVKSRQAWIIQQVIPVRWMKMLQSGYMEYDQVGLAWF